MQAGTKQSSAERTLYWQADENEIEMVAASCAWNGRVDFSLICIGVSFSSACTWSDDMRKNNKNLAFLFFVWSLVLRIEGLQHFNRAINGICMALPK